MIFDFKNLILAFFYAIAIGILANAAIAADAPARCYKFHVQSPAREKNPEPRAELWCYQNISQADLKGVYIFNADGSEARPESALLKTKDRTITHGSLAAGKVSIQTSKLNNFNPISAPLDEPRGQVAKQAPLSPAFLESATAVLNQFQQNRTLAAAPKPTKAGQYSADASYMPWRGYWWPYQGMPLLGPMAKLDALSRSRGAIGGAVDWENSNHFFNGVPWEGHCNGWAAASILRAEPVASHFDPQSAQMFSVSDQKGLLTEADYCAVSTFYGYRNPSSAGVNPKDFHFALTHFIGELHKPIAFNIENNGNVDNRVISGYAMDVQPSGAGYIVNVTLRVHQYDGEISDIPGIADWVAISYSYSLSVDANNNVTDGAWISESPGFVWVPVSTGRCANGNPNMNENYLQMILGQ